VASCCIFGGSICLPGCFYTTPVVAVAINSSVIQQHRPYNKSIPFINVLDVFSIRRPRGSGITCSDIWRACSSDPTSNELDVKSAAATTRGVFPIRRNPIHRKKSYSVSSITFLVRTFCYCNSEQSQHSYAELGYLFYGIRALNARKTRKDFRAFFRARRECRKISKT